MFFDPPEKFRDLGEDFPRPHRLYARVDQIEGDIESDGVVLFDCVNADWVDSQEGETTPIANRDEEDGSDIDRALFILSIKQSDMPIRVDKEEALGWFVIELEDPKGSEIIAEQYAALFSDPNERGVIGIKPVDGGTKVKLDHLAGWGDVYPSNLDEIVRGLQRSRYFDALAIYDVGQGAATALLEDGRPTLYFDFGGSVIGNWRSFPKHLTHFCYAENPAIVLSHWDWDHWSSALRDRRALNAIWILPLQKASGPLGSVHARFLSLLKRHGRALWWDCSQPSLRFGTAGRSTYAVFETASGPQNDRNQSGITMTVRHEDSGQPQVLLPGDASLEYCSIAQDEHTEYMMVPHHGGKTGLSHLPSARRNRTDHLIYSYGVGNIFNHPRDDTVKAFRKAYPKNAHAALRNHTGFGHIGINLSHDAINASQAERLRRIGRVPNHYKRYRGIHPLEIQQWI